MFNITWDAKQPLCDQGTVIYYVSANNNMTGELIWTNSTALTYYISSNLQDKDTYVFSVVPLAVDNISDSTIYGEIVGA